MNPCTPGPWTIDNEGHIYGTHGLIRPYVGRIEDDHDDEQTQANRRLIAAAPELLEALKKINYVTADKAVRSLAQAAIEKVILQP